MTRRFPIRLVNLLLSAMLAFVAAEKIAADCVDVIRSSRLTTTEVEEESVIKQHAENFCKEYSKSSTTSRSASYGLSYSILAASAGRGSVSAETVASKYCSAKDLSQSRDDTYRKYVETISPIAYSAYEQCVKMSEQDLRIDLDAASTLPTELSVAISFSSRVSGDDARLSFASSSDVECRWHRSDSDVLVLKSGSSSLLSCTRDSRARRSYVRIVREDAGVQSLTIPWRAYSDEGIPIDILQTIRNQYDSLIDSVRKAVVAFNSVECPLGWSEYTPAYGRFIRGIDRIGDTDPDGTRSPGEHQEDEFGKHNHNDGSWNRLSRYDGGNTVHAPTDNSRGELNIRKGGVIQETGADETRPKNVALLFCTRGP